jgi:hypothetical protein
VNELEDIVLFCNKDTVIDDFKEKGEDNLQMIQQQLLMPFF